MGLPGTTAFHLRQGHSEAVLNLDFNSRRDQKRARQIHTLERVATLFLGLLWRSECPQLLQKFTRNNETTKGKKDIDVLNWGGPPLGVQILCTFPTPKMGMEQIEQFNMSPGVDFHPVKKYQCIYNIHIYVYLKPDDSFVYVRAQRVPTLWLQTTPQESARYARCCFEISEAFSFSRADNAFEIFEVFEVFRLLCNLQYINWCFEIFEVFSFNRADKAFEFFLSNGDSGYYNTIRRGPKQVATKVRPSSPRKLLEF